jgi:hypothetical protein
MNVMKTLNSEELKYYPLMNPETKTILENIELYIATGEISDALIPYYDQNGRWLGAPFIGLHIKRNPKLDRIKTSHLPASRRFRMDRTGTVLRTSFTWHSKRRLQLKYSGILGSLVVDASTIIHAACLRHIGGSFVTTTDKRVYLPNLRDVGGHFEAMKTFDLQVPRLKHVGGRAKVLGNIPPRLRTVGRSLGVYWGFAAESKHLKSVGDYLCLTKATSIHLSTLEHIGGSFLLTPLTHVIHAPKLKSIGGDFLADAAHDLRLPALRTVGGHMDTSAAKGFYDPRIQVGGAWAIFPGDIDHWNRRDAARKAMKSEDILL